MISCQLPRRVAPAWGCFMGAGPGRSGSRGTETEVRARTWDPSLVLWAGVLGGGSLLAGVSLSLSLGVLSSIRA